MVRPGAQWAPAWGLVGGRPPEVLQDSYTEIQGLSLCLPERQGPLSLPGPHQRVCVSRKEGGVCADILISQKRSHENEWESVAI